MKKNLKQLSSKTKFGEKVLAIVAKIPKGKMMTYSEVAKKAGNAKAVRSVGYWMSKNFDPKIPCHRVVRSDGTIGNYNRGGPKKKLELLKKEGAL
jgi:methylated-DNA-[protein]-cysteine S-methyltransferase